MASMTSMTTPTQNPVINVGPPPVLVRQTNAIGLTTNNVMVPDLRDLPQPLDWGDFGPPPPAPVLVRQYANHIGDVVRRLEFDDSDDSDDDDY